MAPVLVTGAGGWLASHCVYQLLDAGYKVRGTVRDLNSKKYEFLRSFHPQAEANLELVEADLLSGEGWDKAVEGCEYVLHVASPFTFSAKTDEELVKPAVEGVRNVLAACINHSKDVKRVVLTSSVCSVMFGHPNERYACGREAVETARKAFNKSLEYTSTSGDSGSQLDCRKSSTATGTDLAGWKMMSEEDWTVVENVKGYELSKVLAEKEAWKIVNEHNGSENGEKLELTVMCPGFIFGPVMCEAHCNGESSTHILRIMEKTYPCVPGINSPHVDVRDVAAAHILGMTTEGCAGERFIIAADDGNLDFVEQSKLLKNFFEPYGFTIATMEAPKIMLTIGSWFVPAVRVAADKLRCVTYSSNNKAHTILGMKEWRPTSDALVTHALTLMKYGCLTRKNVPEELVSGYRAYAAK